MAPQKQCLYMTTFGDQYLIILIQKQLIGWKLNITIRKNLKKNYYYR